MSGEWGPWIEHDGKSVPAGIVGKYIHAVMNRPTLFHGFSRPVSEFFGISEGSRDAWLGLRGSVVVRYRIRKPRVLLNLIDMVENLPAPSNPKVDA